MNRNKLIIIFIGLLLVFLMVGCQSNMTKTNEPVGSYPATNQDPSLSNTLTIPTPSSGKATIFGTVTHQNSGKPFTNTTIRLAEVYGQGENQSFVLDGAHSPGGMTDANGKFVIADIPAREYVMIVGDLADSNNYVIIHDETGKAIIYNVEAEKITDVGTISIELPYN